MTTVKLSGRSLIPRMVQDLAAAGGTPSGAALRALHAHIFEQFSEAFAGGLLKPPKVRPEPGPHAGGPATLPALAKSGSDYWYIEVTLVGHTPSAKDDLEVTGDNILQVLPIEYGGGISRTTIVKTTEKKTQSNRVVRINHVVLSGQLYQEVLASLIDTSNIQPLLANFAASPGITGFRVVSYDHMLTGARAFCSCARQAHKSMLKEANAMAPNYTKGSWPHKFADLLKGATYLDGVCHLCLCRTRSPEDAVQKYGRSAEQGFESFIDQVMLDKSVDRKTARAEIQQVLGLSKWVREAELYGLVRDLFNDQRVLREASPEWLGRMRLDIYLPELKLAIEHQGEQHYRPIAAFGGDAGYARVIARDALKRELCRANGVEVIDVRFDAPISKPALRLRLQRYLPP